MILERLRTYFREFYNENKWIIFMATMGLCFSCLIRGCIDLLRYQYEEVWLYFEEQEIAINFFLFIFGDILPLCF